MFEYDRDKLKETAQEIRSLIDEKFKDSDGTKSFAWYAVLGEMLRYDQDLNWIADHFYANTLAPCIPAMVKLYNALKANGHDVNNRYEIGSCDRYAAYVEYDGAKVIAFCNQNVSYVLVLVPKTVYHDHKKLLTYTMHARFIPAGRYSRDYMFVELENIDYPKMLNGCIEKFDKDGSEYFRYQDIRDKGYAFTLEANIFSDAPRWHKMDSRGLCNRYIVTELTGYASMIEEILVDIKSS
jgi:hypothetical protein